MDSTPPHTASAATPTHRPVREQDRIGVRRRRRSGVIVGVAVAVVSAAMLSGCSPDGPRVSTARSSGQHAAARPAAPPAALRADVSPGQVVMWSRPVTVTAAGGQVSDVTLRAGNGTTVAGSSDGRRWRTTTTLLPGTRYVLSASATNTDGVKAQREWRFRTAAPARTDFPAVTPLTGATVGVGHPVVIYLDHDVAYRKRFQQRLHVATSKPVTGAWGWIDSRTVAYRPRGFWPAHTRVSVTLDVGKTQTAPGRWIMKDRVVTFTTGRSQVLTIDDRTHQMKVERDGRTIRTIPVSLGKPGFTTRSGTKVVMTRERSRFMDSDTVGIGGSDAYALKVPYALRITASGEFIHGAPWSQWAQGHRNVSHGCTNVSLPNAIWLYDHSLVGDPVVTRGTGRSTEPWNGLGGIWNYTWSQWVERGA